MAKTCRTCGFSALARECNRRHIWVSDTELCGDYKPRETPLLVDRLAKMVRLLKSPVGDAHMERAEAICAANALLEEYEEEVGDGKA